MSTPILDPSLPADHADLLRHFGLRDRLRRGPRPNHRHGRDTGPQCAQERPRALPPPHLGADPERAGQRQALDPIQPGQRSHRTNGAERHGNSRGQLSVALLPSDAPSSSQKRRGSPEPRPESFRLSTTRSPTTEPLSSPGRSTVRAGCPRPRPARAPRASPRWSAPGSSRSTCSPSSSPSSSSGSAGRR